MLNCLVNTLIHLKELKFVNEYGMNEKSVGLNVGKKQQSRKLILIYKQLIKLDKPFIWVAFSAHTNSLPTNSSYLKQRYEK